MMTQSLFGTQYEIVELISIYCIISSCNLLLMQGRSRTCQVSRKDEQRLTSLELWKFFFRMNG